MASLSTRYSTAFVTGASGGLGAAFVDLLLAEGVAVWGTARSYERLARYEKREGFYPVLLDLGNIAQIETSFQQAERDAGGAFDLVINNAGYGVFGAFAATSFDVWRQQINAAITGSALIAHLAVRSFMARNRGTLVNVSSVAVEYPLPFMAGYNIAKAGLSALSESLIFETRGTGVTVIDFRPGDYRTDFNKSMHSLSVAAEPKNDPRQERAWRTLENNLAAAPTPERAAADLRRALWRGKSGTVYSGQFFQVKLAPLFSRLAPAGLRRAIAARYFGAA